MPLDLQLADLPPTESGRTETAAELDQAAAFLAGHPDQWARIYTGLPLQLARTRAAALRRRDQAIVARIRLNGKGHALYARHANGASK